MPHVTGVKENERGAACMKWLEKKMRFLAAEGVLMGVKLNLFGGSRRDIVQHLRSFNQ